MERIDHLLPWSTLGSEKRLSVFRFGCGARKVYIQSSLHADELPGMRTAWELKQRLRLLEAEGRLRGTVELVPVANPVGLGQMIQALHQGRFEMSSGRNFNRDFPDLLDAVIDSVGERLGSDPAANVALVRQALRAALDALPPATSELEGMQRVLYRHACDADLVLDLHCDFEAAIHLYTLPQQWPAFASLAARLGAAVGLLAEESGGGSFDEACSVPWL
ncbi:succinylglutamate desuccinylase/aspartoacylase family protein, partial [Pseudomonas aeruginosa]